MAPLITLLLVFSVAALVSRAHDDRTRSGQVALAAMFVLTGGSHFTKTAALAAMVPPIFPHPVALIYLTGVAELLFAVALVLRPSPRLGWMIAALLVALLPANIYAAIMHVGYGDHGPAYLWFRVPLQLFFIAWALWSTRVVALRRDAAASRSAGGPVAVDVRGTGGGR